tara:strand:- start:851 stop:1492 length:642 start_codon:yes stop_codon:yes gene_type:complete
MLAKNILNIKKVRWKKSFHEHPHDLQIQKSRGSQYELFTQCNLNNKQLSTGSILKPNKKYSNNNKYIRKNWCIVIIKNYKQIILKFFGWEGEVQCVYVEHQHKYWYILQDYIRKQYKLHNKITEDAYFKLIIKNFGKNYNGNIKHIFGGYCLWDDFINIYSKKINETPIIIIENKYIKYDDDDDDSSIDIPDFCCDEHLKANDLHEECVELNK